MTSVRPVAAPPVEPTEAAMGRAVIHAARFLGFRVAHFRPARTVNGWRTAMSGDVGFPDLVICGHGHLWFVELKTLHGRVAPEQLLWGDALKSSGQRWIVCRGRAGLSILLGEMAEHATAGKP